MLMNLYFKFPETVELDPSHSMPFSVITKEQWFEKQKEENEINEKEGVLEV